MPQHWRKGIYLGLLLLGALGGFGLDTAVSGPWAVLAAWSGIGLWFEWGG
ncbi:hypothetical protein ABHF91_00070 [Pseudaeromonas sp. ZJS20]